MIATNETHHGGHLKDVTMVAVLLRLQVLGNVSKVRQVLGILACPVDVADLVLAYGFLTV